MSGIKSQDCDRMGDNYRLTLYNFPQWGDKAPGISSDDSDGTE